jgi:hypothetical protein
LPKISPRNLRMTGRSLRPEWKEVEVINEDRTLNNKDNNMLSRGENIMSSEEIMLTQILFLALEVEEEAEAKSSHATHVGRMGIKHLTVQIRRQIKEKLASSRHKGELLKQKTQKVEGR